MKCISLTLLCRFLKLWAIGWAACDCGQISPQRTGCTWSRGTGPTMWFSRKSNGCLGNNILSQQPAFLTVCGNFLFDWPDATHYTWPLLLKRSHTNKRLLNFLSFQAMRISDKPHMWPYPKISILKKKNQWDKWSSEIYSKGYPWEE